MPLFLFPPLFFPPFTKSQSLCDAINWITINTIIYFVSYMILHYATIVYGSIDLAPTPLFVFDNDVLLSESDFPPEDMEPSSSTPFVWMIRNSTVIVSSAFRKKCNKFMKRKRRNHIRVLLTHFPPCTNPCSYMILP